MGGSKIPKAIMIKLFYCLVNLHQLKNSMSVNFTLFGFSELLYSRLITPRRHKHSN